MTDDDFSHMFLTEEDKERLLKLFPGYITVSKPVVVLIDEKTKTHRIEYQLRRAYTNTSGYKLFPVYKKNLTMTIQHIRRCLDINKALTVEKFEEWVKEEYTRLSEFLNKWTKGPE